MPPTGAASRRCSSTGGCRSVRRASWSIRSALAAGAGRWCCARWAAARWWRWRSTRAPTTRSMAAPGRKRLPRGSPRCRPRPRPVVPEEAGQYGVAKRADILHARFQRAVPRFLDRAGHVIRRVANLGARSHRLRHAAAHEAAHRAVLSVVAPSQRADLVARQPDQAVAALQRVVQEGEFVVPRKGRQPQREPRQVGRHRVAVHAVEAALRD